MFVPIYRERVRERLIETARSDVRVCAAAAVGGSAGPADRWSDLDLSFGVEEGTPIGVVLSDWTEMLTAEFDAVALFDLPFRSSVYRVFLFPGNLQVDVSFTPEAEFGAIGPRFELLFGEAVERPWVEPPSPEDLFGLSVHHAVRARICIERGELWRAEYWIHELRDQVLSLACLRRGLDVHHGRGFDQLPRDVLEGLGGALIGDLRVEALEHGLACATAGLLREGLDFAETARSVRLGLQELIISRA